jgi:Mg/Co/Ni transporter MgtE
MITRALGAKEINSSNIRQLLKKEAILGAISAFILGLVAYIRVVASPSGNAPAAWSIAITISLIVFLA